METFPLELVLELGLERCEEFCQVDQIESRDVTRQETACVKAEGMALYLLI